MTRHVAIIGGGYAGLAAAVTLAAGKRKVTVFEAAQVLGGRARRVDAHGVAVDNGQHLLLGAYAQTLALLRRVHGSGSETELLYRSRLRLERPGAFRLATPPLPAPWHLAAGLLTARGLTWNERKSAVALMRRLAAAKFHCGQELTVATLLDGQSRAAMDYLWTPLCIAALNTPIQTASAQIFLNVLCAAFAARASDSELLLPRVDLSSLFPDAATAYVMDRGGEIRRGTTVTAVAAVEDGVALSVGYGPETFSDVIIAVAPHQLEHVLRGAPAWPDAERAVAEVGRFAYEPIVTAYLQYPHSFTPKYPMLQLDGTPGQWLFDHGPLRDKPGLAAVVISTAMRDGPSDHQTLADAIDAQLRRLMPKLPPPSWLQIIAERRATYACVAGMVRPRAGPIAPRVYLAGDYTCQEFPATLEAATRSGVAAARALLAVG